MLVVVFFLIASTMASNSFGHDSHFSQCLSLEETHSGVDGSSSESSETAADVSAEADCESAPAPHDQDCHCPTHSSGCSHVLGVLFKNVNLPMLLVAAPSVFYELNQLSRPDPLLEGPFQPPRNS